MSVDKAEQLRRDEVFKARRGGTKIALGEVVLDGVGRKHIWVDPENSSAVVDKGSPEKVIASYDVVKTIEGKDGEKMVIYIGGGRNLTKLNFDSTKEYQEWMSSAREVPFTLPNGETTDLVWNYNTLVAEISSDGDRPSVTTIADPNLLVMDISEKPRYRLDGTTMELVKPLGRNSLFGATSHGDPNVSNYGKKIGGGDHGDDFLPVLGKPGKDGEPFHPGSEIPVGMHR